MSAGGIDPFIAREAATMARWIRMFHGTELEFVERHAERYARLHGAERMSS